MGGSSADAACAMSRKQVADIIVESLAEAGVQRCYGGVDDTLNHSTDAGELLRSNFLD